jgi:hypothetical protein
MRTKPSRRLPQVSSVRPGPSVSGWSGSMRRLPVVLAVVAGLLATACGGGDGRLEIGIRRVALDLAFSEEELAEPVPPERIIQMVPAPPEVQEPADLDQFRSPLPEAPAPPIELCPTAPPGAAPADPVTFAVDDPPVAGSYLRHNEGTIEVSTGGALSFTLPFPFISRWDIPSIDEVEVPAPLGLGEPTVHNEWDVEKVLSPSYSVVDRFRLLPDKVQLVSRTTTNGEFTTEFVPDPPVDVYVFGVENTSWTSAGMDDEQGTAMLFQGRIDSREIVDVCGTAVDTYRVEVSETLVNLRTGETSGSAEGEPSIFNVATQFGGLVVREDVHVTQTTRDPGTGAAVVLEFDYVSTLSSIEPEGLE